MDSSHKDAEPRKSEVVGLLGVGLDNTDGHKRITSTEEFLLVGGSKVTHESMQDLALHFSSTLKKRGKCLPQTSVEEILELLQRAAEQFRR